MNIKLKINKSLEENASIYYELAKKAKAKIEPINDVITKYSREFEKAKKEHELLAEKHESIKTKAESKRKKHWYEKFRWFFSSEGFLVIGGRDATTNEIIIKKYLTEGDLVFHTDMSGSPFFVVKRKEESSGKKESMEIGEMAINETASATASFSKAWGRGLASIDVFYVKPEQVSKKTESGEYMTKGSFMIRGKKNYVKPKMELAVAIIKDKEEGNELFISGPVSSVSSQSDKFIKIVSGSTKSSDIAKQIKKKLGGDLDEIIRSLPAGGCRIVGE